MAAIILPPVRPTRNFRTRPGDKFHWTINTHPNNVFTVRMDDDATTSLVGFRNVDHAELIAKMIESYYISAHELPDTSGQLVLPAPHDGPLNFLSLRRWDLAELQMECTKNFLSMVTVEDLDTSGGKFSFDGKLMVFSAEPEFYIQRLEELYII
jgi:hypothetical protein